MWLLFLRKQTYTSSSLQHKLEKTARFSKCVCPLYIAIKTEKKADGYRWVPNSCGYVLYINLKYPRYYTATFLDSGVHKR